VAAETYDLFSQDSHLKDLGMLDPKTNALELTIAGRDFTIEQSPGILQSKSASNTTGAVVWRTSVAVAEWLATPNVFSKYGIWSGDATVLELGSGISGLIPLVLAPSVGRVVATDQHHLLKRLGTNIEAGARDAKARSKGSTRGSTTNIQTLALDWEEDDVQRTMASNGLSDGVDMVIACDCVFNYSLITPFVQACVDICKLRSSGDHSRPTVCVIAQHLRQSDVFEQWLDTFLRLFKVWRVPERLLSPELKGGSGFAVHVGLLR
jgi:predicted nicotinamide N-methyase